MILIAFTVGDSDSSEYESADDASQDHKTDQPSQSESSDTATETSSDEYDDGDDDGGQCHDLDFITNSSVGVTLEQPSTASTPAIAIAHAPRYRTPPPRPTGSYPRPASKTSLLGTSAPSRSSPLSQDQSKDSHLVVLSSNSLGVAGRQRSCSHSSILGTSLSHPRLTSEGSYGSTTASATAPLVRSFSPRLLDSPPWSSTVSNDILQSLPEQEKKRQEAIHELITTEQVYLSYLYLVIDEFQTPLLDQQLITQAESRSIFTDWSSLSELSQSIVDELTRRQKSDAGVVLAVGDVINSRLVERADCFMLYCANYRDASILLAKRVSESKSLRDFLKLATSKPSCRGLDISSFLLQPLQRITRYPLLIKKILEYTLEDHIDHLLLTEALVSAEQFLERINEAIRSGETQRRLEEIQRKMHSSDLSEGLILTSETKHLGRRQILQEGQLRKAKSGRKLYAYLCNDLLLLFIPGKVPGSLRKTSSHSSLVIPSPSPSTESSERSVHDSNSSNNNSSAQRWTLYQPPIPLERIKVQADPGDAQKFIIKISTPVSPSLVAQYSHVPAHLQSSQQQWQSQSSLQSLIQVKASTAREKKAWISAIGRATEALAKAPRDHGMRTSIRPPLTETIGTMTIRLNEGIISSRGFAKSKSFQCSILSEKQVFTTRPALADHASSGMFSVLWRESVIFAVSNLSQSLEVRLTSISPFAPDVFVGGGQIAFHTVVPYGERGTEVLVSLGNEMQVKFFMSYKVL